MPNSDFPAPYFKGLDGNVPERYRQVVELLVAPRIEHVPKKVKQSVFVVVANVVTDQPTEVLLVKNNHVIENLATATANPAFGDAILPRSLNARSLRFQTCGPQELNDLIVELRVMIQDDVLIGDRFRKCFAKLLDDPFCSWVTGDIEVQDLPAAVLDHEKAIDQLESDRGYRKVIEGRDHFTVIPQEGEPR